MSVYINRARVFWRTIIHAAWASVLFVLHVRAIPEPQVAEQQ